MDIAGVHQRKGRVEAVAALFGTHLAQLGAPAHGDGVLALKANVRLVFNIFDLPRDHLKADLVEAGQTLRHGVGKADLLRIAGQELVYLRIAAFRALFTALAIDQRINLVALGVECRQARIAQRHVDAHRFARRWHVRVIANIRGLHGAGILEMHRDKVRALHRRCLGKLVLQREGVAVRRHDQPVDPGHIDQRRLVIELLVVGQAHRHGPAVRRFRRFLIVQHSGGGIDLVGLYSLLRAVRRCAVVRHGLQPDNVKIVQVIQIGNEARHGRTVLELLGVRHIHGPDRQLVGIVRQTRRVLQRIKCVRIA